MQIRLIRETVEEGASLLGSVLEKPFPSEVFEETDSCDISPNGEERWLAAVRQYDQKMSRYDDVIAERLKKKFYSPTGDSRQVCFSFYLSIRRIKCQDQTFFIEEGYFSRWFQNFRNARICWRDQKWRHLWQLKGYQLIIILGGWKY